MSPNDIEKFYDLGNVEGIAFINADNVLEENQMLLSAEVAAALGHSFSTIFSGLRTSGRVCRGFLIRTNKYQFLGLPVPTGTVVLQLDKSQDVDAYYRQAASIIGMQGSTAAAAPASVAETQSPSAVPTPSAFQPVVNNNPTLVTPAQPQPRQLNTQAQPMQPTLPGQQQPVPQQQQLGEAEISAIWNDFSGSLSKALARVAPQNLAKSLVSKASAKVLGGAAMPSSLDQIAAIGQIAVSSVPNAGRRKLVEKELQIIAKRLNLPV